MGEPEARHQFCCRQGLIPKRIEETPHRLIVPVYLVAHLIADLVACAIKYVHICQSIPDEREHQLHETGAVCFSIRSAKRIIVLLLPNADQVFNRQPKEQLFPLSEQKCVPMRPMRPFPSAKGWINSNS